MILDKQLIYFSLFLVLFMVIITGIVVNENVKLKTSTESTAYNIDCACNCYPNLESDYTISYINSSNNLNQTNETQEE